MITATIEAIKIAIKNEATMVGYTIEEFGTVPGVFYVQSDEGKNYTVNTRAGVENCTCPFFQAEGICKHFVRCEKDAALEAEAAERDFYGIF